MKEFADALVQEAEKKAGETVKEAEKAKDSALREKKKSIDKHEKEQIELLQRHIKEKKEEALASAKLDYKREIEQSKQQKINEALQEAAEAMEKYRKTEQYKKWVKKNLKLALDEMELSEKEAIVHCAKGDKRLFEKCNVKEDLEDIAGFTVESKNAKMRMNYSFSQLLDKKSDEIRKMLDKELFKK